MSTANGNASSMSSPPSMGTRKRTAQSQSASTTSEPQKPTSSQIASTSANLPPSRKSKPMKPVSPPLSSFSFNKFIYTIVLLTALLGAVYTYRVVQHKKEVGGWWNLVRGKGPVPGVREGDAVWNKGKGKGPKHSKQKGSKAPKGEWHDEPQTVEDRINALALSLGIPSPDLARAIAGAVRQYVPPASLSSIAADPRETGKAVEVLLSKEVVVDDGTGMPVSVGGGVVGEAGKAEATGTAAGVVNGVVGGLESFVGMDEP